MLRTQPYPEGEGVRQLGGGEGVGGTLIEVKGERQVWIERWKKEVKEIKQDLHSLRHDKSSKHTLN